MERQIKTMYKWRHQKYHIMKFLLVKVARIWHVWPCPKRNMINVCEEGGHKCHICEKIWMNECLFVQTNMVKHSKNIQEGDNLNCECLICVKALSCISELWEDVKRCHKVNLSKTKETDQWKRDSIPSIFVDKKKKYVALFDLWKPSLSVNYSGQN